ncbi:hypothetical protein NW768_004826 [Fusarium equiseti]|uniref:Uncharacterized protein n=1 Tax=Fusarium equiseti TaxID=61235 RepID=A0ABQ8RHA4_FUSEQ|nr:hypothetical protein NW768_004826 [Fusarium equiseti]
MTPTKRCHDTQQGQRKKTNIERNEVEDARPANDGDNQIEPTSAENVEAGSNIVNKDHWSWSRDFEQWNKENKESHKRIMETLEKLQLQADLMIAQVKILSLEKDNARLSGEKQKLETELEQRQSQSAAEITSLKDELSVANNKIHALESGDAVLADIVQEFQAEARRLRSQV